MTQNKEILVDKDEEPIRLDDGRWTFPAVVSAITCPYRPGAGFAFWFVLMLSGGTRIGSRQFECFVRRPGLPTERMADPVTFVFDGPGYGHQVMPAIWLLLDREGFTWFDVLMDGSLLTSVPLLITHRRD